MRVKICGITNINDALLACELGANALGFVFYKNSKRYIDPYEAAKIIVQLPPFVTAVGVFVNSTIDEINLIEEISGIDFIQLHERNENYDSGDFYKPVIETFRIKNDFNFKQLPSSQAKYLLLDSFNENEFGGTGESFDWEIIPDLFKNKIILAGGISVDNIEQVFNKINPAAVDLSSSIEEYPGKKSDKKLKEFFKKINLLRGTKC